MSAVFSSQIAKFAFAILSFSGASLLTANILSSTSGKAPALTTNNLNKLESLKPSRDRIKDQEQVPDRTPIPSSTKEKQTPQYKNCEVVLTSKDEDKKPNYKVVTCDNSPRLKNWYIFDGNKGSLEQIDGLTTENNTGTAALSSTASWWKEQKWQGYKGRASYRYWGKDKVGSPFELKYVSEDTAKFPFFKYLKLYCRGLGLRRYSGLRFLDSSCSHFDIPVNDFGMHLIKNDLKQAFGNEKDVCLTRGLKSDSKKKWELTQGKCEPHLINKSS